MLEHTLLRGEHQQSPTEVENTDQHSCLISCWMTPARCNSLQLRAHVGAPCIHLMNFSAHVHAAPNWA